MSCPTVRNSTRRQLLDAKSQHVRVPGNLAADPQPNFKGGEFETIKELARNEFPMSYEVSASCCRARIFAAKPRCLTTDYRIRVADRPGGTGTNIPERLLVRTGSTGRKALGDRSEEWPCGVSRNLGSGTGFRLPSIG